MWVLIDNYDSFTWILHDYLLQTGHECTVYRNDEISVQGLQDIQPERIILSPGPGTPVESGICMNVIDHFHKKIPLLGICLGHQALGVYFGAKLAHAAYPMHGKTSIVTHNGHPLFKDIASPFEVMRYHSLIIEPGEGTNIEILATAADDRSIMALEHSLYPSIGIQFHPESVGTIEGLKMLKNWERLYT
jgi:anthranilate synthase/aminodeoxychorismate synthase-like glutamine amidotransferase